MKIFRNTALAILFVLVINIVFCSVFEMNALNASTHNLRNSMNVAAKYATESFQITQFSGFDDTLGTTYNISDTFNRAAYTSYLQKIEQQGNNLGLNTAGSDFNAIITFFKEEISDYSPSDPDATVVAPFAVSWTFLEEKRLEREFRNSLTKIIKSNYDPSSGDTALAFSGKNILRLKNLKAEIVNGPKLINLSAGLSPSDPNYQTYLSLFGSSRAEAMAMFEDINTVEEIYNYVIVYDVKFTAEWEHHTTTPFFSGYGRILPAGSVDERGQVKLDMNPMVIKKRYVVTN